MSKPLTCLIVDDEPPAIRILQKYVEMLPDLDCVATTTRSLDVLGLLDELRPDIIFLDIQMPDLTGIQLSSLIKGRAGIIFTTAYPQYAIEGFEANAIDYLLKPIAFSRFIDAVEKVRVSRTQPAASLATTLPADDYFFVKTDGRNKFRRVAVSDIIYVESIKNYVVIHTPQEQIVTYNTLKYFEENLPKQIFIKIHKSYIVALNKIESTDSSLVVIMKKTLPLGDTYRTEFFERINQKKL